MMNQVRRVLKSRLFSNIWNQFILTGFSYVVPILLIPFLINRIGLGNYGLLNFIIATSCYFLILIEFGFDLSNVQLIVPVRENRSEVSRIVSTILCSKVLFLLLSGVILFLLVFFFPELRRNYILYILAFFWMSGFGLNITWLFRSMEDVKYVTRMVLPIKIISLSPIFILVKDEKDTAWVLFCYMLETLSGAFFSIFLAFRRYNLFLYHPSSSEVWTMLKYSWPYFTSTFLTRVTQVSNPILLGIVRGDYYVGVYTAAEKLHNAYASFISPLLAHVLYPYFARIKSWAKINRIVLVVLFSNFLILTIMYWVSPYLIPYILKTGGEEVQRYFNLFLILLVISIPANLLGFPYLGVMGHVNKVRNTITWTSGVYLLLLFVLYLTDCVTIGSLILVLIVVNLLSLSGFLYHILCMQKMRFHR